MINIEERRSDLVSGFTSLFINFKFNKDIVDVIKGLETRAYHKDTFTWEVPVNCLASLLDSLTYIDDITLKLYKDDDSEDVLIPKGKYKSKPFQHQIEAVEYGLNNPNFLLLDQPGLGKSASIIYLAQELKEQKGLEHCLIICGINTLKSNWRKEIKIHSDLSCKILGEKVTKKGTVYYKSIKERAEEIMSPIEEFFIIVNIESLRSDEIITAFKKTKNKIDMVVVDEVHKASNQKSAQGGNLLKLTNYKHKIGLSGTLITNSPVSCFLPLKWIGVEKSNLTNFKSQYCVFGGFGGHQIVGYKNIDVLKDIIDKCSLRRTKNLLDIPPKTVISEIVEMDPQHRDFYERIKNGVKNEALKVDLNPTNVLALTTRLRQATVCPSIITEENVVSSKLKRAAELASDIISNGDKVVVMSTFKEPVKQLAEMLKDYDPLIGTGDIADDVISNNIDKFQTDPECRIFIGTYAKLSTGITLNAATYMICLDECFSYSDNLQAQDRIHRVTNKSPVFIYNLICIDTIDERVDEIAQTKQDFSDYIIDDKANANLMNRLRNYIQDLN